MQRYLPPVWAVLLLGGLTAACLETVRADVTGFWHIEHPADSVRTWLVDPDGNRVFGLGVNSVMRNSLRNGRPSANGILNYIKRTDPTAAANLEWARLGSGESNGFTDSQPYGFNSVGAFSEGNDFDSTGGLSYMVRPSAEGGAGAPYARILSLAPRGDDRALKAEDGTVLRTGYSQTRVGDPWNPKYLADLDTLVAETVAPSKDDPGLQRWDAGNETGMFDVAAHANGVRDFRRWIWSNVPVGSSIDRPLCARHALAAFLRDRYRDDIDALNTAWQSSYTSFSAIVDSGPRPVPYEHDANQKCREDLQRFVHERLLREWVRAVTTRIRAADPNHLVASPRLAIASATTYRFWQPASASTPDVWVDSGQKVGTDQPGLTYCPYDLLARDGNAGFDVVAINCYTGRSVFTDPWFSDGLRKIMNRSGLPIIISEFGIRAKISGWSNKGGAGSFVNTQDERGQRYQSQIDQFISFTNVIGANWHAWSDRYIPGDTSLQINMGIVQVDDPVRRFVAGARWTPIDAYIADTNFNIMDLIAAKTGL